MGEKLKGDKTVEAGVLSFVHNTHSALAQRFEDAVVRDYLANHKPVACSDDIAPALALPACDEADWLQ
jgi:hypothetical protein